MNRNITYLFLLLLIACSTTKQINNDISTFQLKQIIVKDISKIEKLNKGAERFSDVPTSQGYFPDLNNYKFSQPKFYNRKKGNLLTEVSYYYSEKDSVVRLISYAWDELNSSDSIRNIYNENEKIFTEFFKKKGNEKKIRETSFWEDELRWENKDIHVFQFILGNKKGAQRTRTIICWK